MLKPFRLVLIFGSSLLFTVACTKPKAPEPKSKQQAVAAAPSQPTLKTSGTLRLLGLPVEGMTACEVIVVERLEPEARQRIERQRELLEQKLTGVKPSDSSDDAYGMGKEDFVQLSRELTQLQQGFPEQKSQVLGLESQNGRAVKFSSDAEMYKDFKHLFDSINFDNIERALPFIKEKLKSENQSLVAESKQARETTYKQNNVTLDWLDAVAAYLNEYISFKKQVLSARQANAKAKLQAADHDPQDWDAYSNYYRDLLLIDVSQHSLGAAMVGSDGHYEVEGQGEVIVRVEYAPNSAYFIVTEDEQRVRIEKQ